MEQQSQELQQELTYGQKAVGLTFNPSGDPEVIKAKQIAADAIDQMNDLRNSTNSAEVRRMGIYCDHRNSNCTDVEC